MTKKSTQEKKRREMRAPLRPQPKGHVLYDPDEQFGRIRDPCLVSLGPGFERPGCRKQRNPQLRVQHRTRIKSQERTRSKSRERTKGLLTSNEAGDTKRCDKQKVGTLEDVDLDKQLSGDWNLFDEIATHFRQVDEYQDMVHIFDERVVEEIPEPTPREELLDSLKVSRDHLGNFGEKLEFCTTGLKDCSRDLEVFKSDVEELSTIQDTQIQKQKHREKKMDSQIKILQSRVDTVNQDSERMARKLCIVDQAGTNDVIAESFRQFNTMVEELHAAHKDNKKTVEAWNVNTINIATRIREEMKAFERRKDGLDDDIQTLFAEHRELMSLLAEGDHSVCKQKLLEKKMNRKKVEWKPNPQFRPPDERTDWRKVCTGKDLYGKKNIKEHTKDWGMNIENLRKVAIEQEKTCQKSKPDVGPGRYTKHKFEKKEDRGPFRGIRDRDLMERQGASLMAEPVNMYRHELNLSRPKNDNEEKHSMRMAASVISVTNIPDMTDEELRRKNYRERFLEDIQQRRLKLKEVIKDMSDKIQQQCDTKLTKC